MIKKLTQFFFTTVKDTVIKNDQGVAVEAYLFQTVYPFIFDSTLQIVRPLRNSDVPLNENGEKILSP